jgi:multidrug efflux pump subunit AcrA (membrane-fusion protein)
LACALLIGCGTRHGESGHSKHDNHAHSGSSIAVPAVIYKAGHGLQLGPAAADFIGLATAEVASRDLPGVSGVPTVPESAVLRTVRGEFVFVANGGWFLRTPVRTGRTADGCVEILDGLYDGDTVVEHGTRYLWLAEIQAVNGGVSCTDGH